MPIALPLCLVLLLFPWSVAAELKVATIDWCPFICPDSPEKPGLLVEYVQEIYRNADTKVTFEVYPWSRAIKMANEGKVDALLAPAKNEAPLLRYPKHEIGVQNFCFFGRTDDPWHYDGPASLSDRSLIYPSDALPKALDPLPPRLVAISYPYNQAYMPKGIDILLKKRVDTLLMTNLSMRQYLNIHKLGDKVHPKGCVSSQKLYLAFTPEKANDALRPLIDHFDRRIAELRQQGYFHSLLAKYHIK